MECSWMEIACRRACLASPAPYHSPRQNDKRNWSSILRLPAALPPPPKGPPPPLARLVDWPKKGEFRFPLGAPRLTWLKAFRALTVAVREYFFPLAPPP